jgi:hypothetical protein
VFGNQEHYFKHPLVEASKHCDVILAVGEPVAEELRFLGPEFETKDISVVYNGIPAGKTTLEEKMASKEKLQQYCLNLLGYKPDWIFSHVTRLVRSKGLWRDLKVLWHIDAALNRAGRSAVMYLVSTEVGQRRSRDIFEMEAKYDWPVAHREGWPDLSGGEATFYTAIQEFNAKSKSVKVVFINQFGFSRKHCGNKMPEDMQMADIHKGTDVEFGQSIYEPFGIAPLEPLTFGGLSVFSSVCGCAGFVKEAAETEDRGRKTEDGRQKAEGRKQRAEGGKVDGTRNFLIADYTADGEYADYEALLKIGRAERDQIEEKVAGEVADEILMLLPKSEQEVAAMIEAGWRISKNMSWDVVVSRHLWPALKKILSREKAGSVSS